MVRPIYIALMVALVEATVSGCGRAPSRLLRQGQLPVYDFPLYLTEGVSGNVWKIERDRTRTLLVSGLSDPRGIATDRFDNLYVSEYGAGRLLKVDTGDGSYAVMNDSLESPSIVGVDSFGEPFVAQDTEHNIIRATDNEVFNTYDSLPSAFVFGVDDQIVVGLYGENKVYWGGQDSGKVANVTGPVGAAVDGTGRVYVSEGSSTNGRILRFHQREPGGEGTVVAQSLQNPLGIAVDPASNIFVIEQAGGRIVLIDPEGKMYEWLAGFLDPQYLAFTQY